MTLYLCKYGDSDFKLCKEDGTILASFNSYPSRKEMINNLKDKGRLNVEKYCFRDLTIEDETVPFDSTKTKEPERIPNVGWAQISGFDETAEKPLQVERDYKGKTFQFWTYVTKDVVDAYQSGELAVGDFVSIVYVDHELEKPLAQQKLYKSW